MPDGPLADAVRNVRCANGDKLFVIGWLCMDISIPFEGEGDSGSPNDIIFDG